MDSDNHTPFNEFNKFMKFIGDDSEESKTMRKMMDKLMNSEEFSNKKKESVKKAKLQLQENIDSLYVLRTVVNSTMLPKIAMFMTMDEEREDIQPRIKQDLEIINLCCDVITKIEQEKLRDEGA